MIGGLTREEETENLEDKIRLLALLRGRVDFADIQKAYDNWRFSDLIGDNDFKRMYLDQAVKEREKPVSEYFEENIDKYIKLVEEGKEITSRYFGKWKVNFQAYCEEINNNRVLNVNLIHYDKSEPTRISDILQQEKDIKALNIYCNKKHEIYAHQEDKKRYYEFKEGAYYEMTSTWPVENGSRMCTMIMNVSSSGITEVLKFDGEDFVSSEEILELIKQNDELYIQGLSLYDAVIKSLEKGKLPDVVPVANNDLQSNESIRVNKDGGQGDLENGASTPSFTDKSTQTEETLPDVVPVANSDTSTQMEVDLQQPETQTEIDLQQIDWLLSENCKLRGENAELIESNEQLEDKIVILEGKLKKETQRNIKLQAELEQKNEGLASALVEEQKMEEGLKSMREEKRKLEENLRNVKVTKERVDEKLTMARQDNEELDARVGCLQSIREWNMQENAKLQAKLAQKDEEFAKLQEEKKQGLENMCEKIKKLKEVLKITNAEKERLESELKELAEAEERDQEAARQYRAERDKAVRDLCSQLQEKDRKIEELTNERELEDEQAERQREQLLEELDKYGLQVKSRFAKYEDQIKELKESRDALYGIIADKVLDIEGLTKELQDSKKEIENLRNQVEMLSAETVADKQKGFNDQYYTLTGDISSEPDNALRKKGRLSKSSSFDNESYVLLEEKTTLLRSSSVDSGLDSDEENCDDNLFSNITTTSTEKVAESRKRR